MALAVSNVASTRAASLKATESAASAAAKFSKPDTEEASAEKDFQKVLSHARTQKPATRKGAPDEPSGEASAEPVDAKKSTEPKKTGEAEATDAVDQKDQDQPDADQIIADKPEGRADLVTPGAPAPGAPAPGAPGASTDSTATGLPGTKGDKPLVTALDSDPAKLSDPGAQGASNNPENGVKTGEIPVEVTDAQPSDMGEEPPVKPGASADHADAPTLPDSAGASVNAAAPKSQGHEVDRAPALPVTAESHFAESNIPKIVTGVTGQLLPNGGTMHIRLDPPEMGALTVSIRMDRGTVEASFQTSTDQATQLLGHSLTQLKTALESAGINVDKLNVSQVPADKQASSNNPQNQQNSQQSQEEARQFQQEQQRRQMLQRMWQKLSGNDDLDMVA